MPYVVTFEGTSAVRPAKPDVVVWTYRIEPSGADALAPGEIVALGLPAGLPLEGQNEWPQLGELGGVFVQDDTGTGQQFVGRAVSTAGTQTLSFVGPAATGQCPVQLVTAEPGVTWSVNPYSLGPGAPALASQML